MTAFPRFTIRDIDLNRLVALSYLSGWAASLVGYVGLCMLWPAIGLYLSDPTTAVAGIQMFVIADLLVLLGIVIYRRSVLSSLVLGVLIGIGSLYTLLVRSILSDYWFFGIAAASLPCVSLVFYLSELTRRSPPIRTVTRSPPREVLRNTHLAHPLRLIGSKILTSLGVLVISFCLIALFLARRLSAILFLYFAFRFTRNSYRRSKTLEVLAAQEVKSLDSRRPILLLRAFTEDRLGAGGESPSQQLNASSLTTEEPATFEEKLTRPLSRFAPVLALGAPGEALPPVGASREYVSNEVWQHSIETMMQEAQLIIVLIARSEGLDWELRRIAHLHHLPKTILVVPPSSAQRAGESEKNSFERVTHALRIICPELIPSLSMEQLGRVSVLRVAEPELILYNTRWRTLRSSLSALEVASAQTLALQSASTSNAASDKVGQGSTLQAASWLRRALGLFLSMRPPTIKIEISVAILSLLLFTALLSFVMFSGLHEGWRSIALSTAFLVVSVNVGLACCVLFCWLLKIQARYASGWDYMEEVVGWLAVASLPVLLILLAGSLGSALLGKDAFLLLKVGPGGTGGSGLGPWAVGLMLVLGAVWTLTRFVIGLGRMWGATTFNAVASVILALTSSTGLLFAARSAIRGVENRVNWERQLEELRNREDPWRPSALSGSAVSGNDTTAASELKKLLCRSFKPLDTSKLLTWASAFNKDVPAEARFMVDDDGNQVETWYCLKTPVAFWVLIGAELKYGIARRSGSPEKPKP